MELCYTTKYLKFSKIDSNISTMKDNVTGNFDAKQYVIQR